MLGDPKGRRRSRDPRRTRERLLRAGFQEVYRRGFQSASIDTILAATNVTKGALYHHFDSKEALGHAIVDEIISKFTERRWLRPLQRAENPVDILIDIVRATSIRPKDVKGGCPLLNLAQEMSPLDEQFRRQLEAIYKEWQEAVVTVLRRGQCEGMVRRDVVPQHAAGFLIAMYEGYAVLAKNTQDPKMWDVAIKNIVGWLETLRAPRRSKRTRSPQTRIRTTRGRL